MPSHRYCCAISNCRNYTVPKSESYEGISLHVFPNNESVRQKWILFSNKHTGRLCSKHFTPSCFFGNTKQRKRLKFDAHPTLYPPLSNQECYDVPGQAGDCSVNVTNDSSDTDGDEQDMSVENISLPTPVSPTNSLQCHCPTCKCSKHFVNAMVQASSEQSTKGSQLSNSLVRRQTKGTITDIQGAKQTVDASTMTRPDDTYDHDESDSESDQDDMSISEDDDVNDMDWEPNDSDFDDEDTDDDDKCDEELEEDMHDISLYLSCLHYNENAKRQRSVKLNGVPRYRLYYPKCKKGGHVLRHELVPPTYEYGEEILREIFQRYTEFGSVLAAEMDERIASQPPPLAESRTRISLPEAVRKHQTRYAMNTLQY